MTDTNLLWAVKMAALPDNQAYALLALGPSRLFVTSNALVRLKPDGSVILLGPYRQDAEIWPTALNKLLPYSPPSLKSLTYVPGLGFSMSFDLVRGQTYDLQVSGDLRDWKDLTVLTGGVSPPTASDSASASLPQRFYRLVVR